MESEASNLMEDRTDAALIHQARTGDREAFRGLVERHQDRVFGLAVTMLGNRTEAEDVAQEVFLKAYRNLAAFRGDARFGTWLYRVTVNGCWDVLRRRRRVRQGLAEAAQQPPSPSPLPPMGGEDQGEGVDVERVRAALARLEPDDRAVLRLREIDGLPYEDMATTLGVTVEAVKSRLFRARERFREVWHATE